VRVKTQPKVKLFDNNKLIEPKAIPKKVVAVREQAPPPSSEIAGVTGGVPGGTPGGTMGGVMGAAGNGPAPPPPPKPKAKTSGPVRVGGEVRAPKLVRNVQPAYPPLARQIHVQGAVVLDCVIDKQGNVTQMRVISGHPLLVGAAMQAVKQWKYAPTLLNGTPVDVAMNVTVNFSLAG
jgi:periplasmic protein TonB